MSTKPWRAQFNSKTRIRSTSLAALASTQMVLVELGLTQVKLLVATQIEVGPNLEV